MKTATALIAALTLVSSNAKAQENSITYYLPQTALQMRLSVEKTEYTPGQFAAYAKRYMKKQNVPQQAQTSYRLLDIKTTTIAVPDTNKCFHLSTDKKYNIHHVQRTDNGILLAINTQNKNYQPQERNRQTQVMIARPLPPRLEDFMNEDILTAGSTAKMAELTAQEIYDIRDSRNQLQRGQAEFMPKDGQQLKIMMSGLDKQEKALMQTFEGVTAKDTTEVIVVFVPQKTKEKQLVFRFSQFYGVTDNDDLSGTPYYAEVEDLNTTQQTSEPDRDSKDDLNLHVCIPGKISVTLVNDRNEQIKKYDLYAAQFGTTEQLSGALFGKKQTSQIVFNHVTGGIESINEETDR